MRSRHVVPLALFAGVALAGCGDDVPNTAPTESTASITSEAEPTSTIAPTSTTVASGADLYGVRYCEILAVTIDAVNTTAEVWGTQGINDCPDEAFRAIDPAVAATDLGATVALANGPRFWVLDRIVANELAGSLETHDFGGIEMRSIAFVELGPGVPDRSPYIPRRVERDTEFVFEAGREVYELTSPDGSVYIMQSYTIERDPTLTADALAALGDRLELPAGWTFSSRVLDAELVVEDIDGFAAVIQDELNNSYQLSVDGTTSAG